MRFTDIFNKLISHFTSAILIDLGTSNIRIVHQGLDKILTAPSVVALNIQSGKIIAVGDKAEKMLGRTPEEIKALYPLRDGVISDYNSTEALLSHFISLSRKNFPLHKRFIKPSVIIAVPSTITEVEINAVTDAAKSGGAGRVHVVEEPIAAAIGSGLILEDPSAFMIVDIGGGTTNIAIISQGEVLIDNTIKIAGNSLDLAIIDYIKNKYNLLIGKKNSEELKIELASLSLNHNSEYYLAKGQDILTGLPKSINISSVEVNEAIMQNIESITAAIREVIEKSPPEILSDLSSNAIHLSGGSCKIIGLDKYLFSRVKIPIIIGNDPELSVINGISKISTDYNLLLRLKIKDFILK
jgi:rod shape-determining protein MreB and related proteins